MDTSYVLWLAIAGSVAFMLGGPGMAASAIFICALYLLARHYDRSRKERLAALEEARQEAEAVQEPALQKDGADWTRLDELALNIARHEVLTAWDKNGRSAVREVPIPDIEADGGYRTLADGFGEEISHAYEQVFREVRALLPHQRWARQDKAIVNSLAARMSCHTKAKETCKTIPIERPLPDWMSPSH